MQHDTNKEPFSRRRLLQRGAVAAAGLAGVPMTLLTNSEDAQAASAEPKMQGAGAAPTDILASLRRERPRLLASADTWPKLKEQRGKDALLAGFLRRGEAEARALLTVEPVTYKKEGRRLLTISRIALRRVLLLSLHYRLTGDAALAQRAQKEMLAAAAFIDWNPSHFLDVGEMTAALAFGYDWLYDVLDADTRKTIATAIVEKGLRPGLEGNPSWMRGDNNWNQVCLGGLSLGALALAEEEPELAAQVLERTKNFNHNGLKPYAPDGVYPEGAMYWYYGTTFQTVLLDALQSALGTDWGLSKSAGFLATAEALNQQLAPSGTFFNFSDGVERPGLEPAMWWFARTLKRPELLRYEQMRLQEYATSTQLRPESLNDRLLPLAALWWQEPGPAKAKPELPRNWRGRGPNSIAVFRSEWDNPKAMYLAIKAGGPSLSHAHMDSGAFVFESDGIRWACDLGMQNYNSLESKGIDLWGRKQDSGRWGVYRIGPFSHNTLTINKQLHRADGLARLTHFADKGDAGAIVDLSAIFQGQAERVGRGFVFRPGSHALIRDEIEGLKAGEVVRWAMLTHAEVAVSEGDGTEAILTQSGQKLRVKLQASVRSKFEVLSADPPNDFDAPNPGMRLLVAHLTAPESGRLDLSVLLQPVSSAEADKAPQEKLANVELHRWPQAPV